VVFQTDDLRATDGESPSSEYELKTSERGGTVHAIDAVPGPRPAPAPGSIVQPVPESLFEYLPDDLEHLEYVPLGMAGAVENMRNHRRRMAAHAAREQARVERDGREQAAVEQAARDARALEERAAQLAQDAQADADTATNPRWR
jgi:tRNA (guanine-N7-)-methyltransferase